MQVRQQLYIKIFLGNEPQPKYSCEPHQMMFYLNMEVDGQTIEQTKNIGSEDECAQACFKMDSCVAFSFHTEGPSKGTSSKSFKDL